MSTKLDDAIAAYQLRKASGKNEKPLVETDIEKYGGSRVKHLGGWPYKFTSPARRSVPDRLNLLPIPPEHREIVARYVRFVEYKAPGKKPTTSQKEEHERLRALGFYVAVLDTLEGCDQEFSTTLK